MNNELDGLMATGRIGPSWARIDPSWQQSEKFAAPIWQLDQLVIDVSVDTHTHTHTRVARCLKLTIVNLCFKKRSILDFTIETFIDQK